MLMLHEEFRLSKNPEVHFRELSEQIQLLAARESVSIRAYEEDRLPHFSKLDPSRKLQVLKALTHQKDYFEIGISDKIPLNSPQLLWRVLQRMKMTPKSDILDKVADTDMVEIYWADGTILFKNLAFFRLISMTLEEVFCLKWHEQIRFSPKMFLFFMEVQAKFHLSLFDNSFQASFIRSYIVREKLGSQKSLWAQLKWASPVFHEKRKCALLLISESGNA